MASASLRISPFYRWKGLEEEIVVLRLIEIVQAFETVYSRQLHFTSQEGEAQMGHKKCPTQGHVAEDSCPPPTLLNPDLVLTGSW